MANNIEYLELCGLSKHPFKPSSSLVSASSVQLADNCILDAVFSCNDQDIFSVYLKRIYLSAGTLHVILGLLDSNLTELYTRELTAADTIVEIDEIDTMTEVDGKLTAKIIVGQGLVDMIGEGDFDLTFAKQDAMFSGDTVRLAPNIITAVSFYNQNDLVHNFTSSIDWQGGYNVRLSDVDPTMQIDVLPGTGLGLYDGCSDAGSIITSINGQTADNQGNFIVNTDGCYTKIPGTNMLEFDQQCTAACGEEAYRGYAYYLNRLRDGIFGVGAYYNDTVADFSELIATYQAKLDTIQAFKAPYIKVIANELVTNNVKMYPTFVTGIYMPDKQPITASLSVVLPDLTGYGFKDPLGDPIEDNNQLIYVLPQTQSIKQDNNKKELISGNLGFGTRQLECKRDIVYQFTLSTPSVKMKNDSSVLPYGETLNLQDDPTGTGTIGLADIVFNLDWGQGNSGYVYPLYAVQQQRPDFHTSYTVEYRNNSYYAHVELEFVCSTQPSLLTNVEVRRPQGLTVQSANTLLLANNQSATLTLLERQTPSFTATLDYSKRNVFSFDMVWAGDSCNAVDPDDVTLQLDILMSTPLYTFTRTVELEFSHE